MRPSVSVCTSVVFEPLSEASVFSTGGMDLFPRIWVVELGVLAATAITFASAYIKIWEVVLVFTEPLLAVILPCFNLCP